jgi:hypothetical protein
MSPSPSKPDIDTAERILSRFLHDSCSQLTVLRGDDWGSGMFDSGDQLYVRCAFLGPRTGPMGTHDNDAPITQYQWYPRDQTSKATDLYDVPTPESGASAVAEYTVSELCDDGERMVITDPRVIDVAVAPSTVSDVLATVE